MVSYQFNTNAPSYRGEFDGVRICGRTKQRLLFLLRGNNQFWADIKITKECAALLTYGYGNLGWCRASSMVFVECSLGHPGKGKEGPQMKEYGEAKAVEGHGEVVGVHGQQHNVGHC